MDRASGHIDCDGPDGGDHGWPPPPPPQPSDDDTLDTSQSTVVVNKVGNDEHVETSDTPDKPQQQYKPRRRRLANRRQYSKSCRLASSYLRSQFVRLNSNENDDLLLWARNSVQPQQELHSARMNDKINNDKQHKSLQPQRSPLPLAGSHSRAPSESYDEWSADDALAIKSIIDKQEQQQQQQQQQHNEAVSNHRRAQVATLPDGPLSTSCPKSHRLEAAGGHHLADQSSSSLDSSYSPVDHKNWYDPFVIHHQPKPRSQNYHHQRRTLRSTFNSSVAKSLMSLTNFATHSLGSSENLTHQQQAKSGVSRESKSARGIKTVLAGALASPSGAQKSLAATRATTTTDQPLSERSFVRSETVDLKRIAAVIPSTCDQVQQQQQAPPPPRQHSPRLKFFPTSGTNSSQESVLISSFDSITDKQQRQISARMGHAYADSSQTLAGGQATTAESRHVPQYHSVDQISKLRHQKKNIDCIDNVHFNDLFHGTVTESSTSVTVNQSVRTDPRLHKDDVDIKFSRALNSCKLPQIRYASKERLFERLTDLRFLSIDFLNTFLLTYRVFTTAEDVLEALKSVHYNSDRYRGLSGGEGQQTTGHMGDYRDSSFGCYANSSVTNLSQNLHGSCNQIAEDHHQVKERQRTNSQSLSPKLEPNSTVGTSHDKKPQQKQQHEQVTRKPIPQASPISATANQRPKQPPVVPPRSPACLIQANSSSQLDQNNNFLLTPNAHMLNQKRRSTISALTPITGSTASSLVNLAAKCSSSSKDDDIILEHQRAPSTMCADYGSGEQHPNDEHDELLPMSPSLDYSSDRNLHSPVPSVDNLNQILDSALYRPRSSSFSIVKNSANIGNIKLHGTDAGGPASGNNLTVPGRQVRASSLSHVSPIIIGIQTPSTAALGNEHWRLSYKKSTGATKASSTSQAQPTTAGLPGSTSNLLSPNYVPGTHGPAVPVRRKSAADAEHIKFQVEMIGGVASTNTRDNNLSPTNNHDSPSHSRLQLNYLPDVPPSTPVDPNTRAPSPMCLNLVDTKEDDVRVKLSSPDITKIVKNLKSNNNGPAHQGARRDRKDSSGLVVSSTSSSHYSSDEDENLHLQVSKSDSSALHSTLSSSNDDLPAGLERAVKPLTIESRAAQGKPGDNVDSTNQTHSQPPRRLDSLSRKRQQSFILKEIDLTQSRIIDSDTSADESEASSSVSGESAECASPLKPAAVESGAGPPEARVVTRVDRNRPPEIPRRDLTYQQRATHNQKAKVTEIPSKETRTGNSQSKLPNGDPIESRGCPASTEIHEDAPSTPNREQIITTKPSDKPVVAASLKQEPKQDAPSVTRAQPMRSPQKPPGVSSSCLTTPRSSFQYTAENPVWSSKAGVVVTSRSPRVSSRRSSTASAASAFAAATAASSNPLLTQPPPPPRQQINKSPLGELTSSVDPANCACAHLHRGSMSTILPQRRQAPPMDVYRSHHPTCIHSQYAGQVNFHSDASSLCNSRASSRLSSCAGLEFSYHSQQQQQPFNAGNNSLRQQVQAAHQQQAFYNATCRHASYQSNSSSAVGCGHFGSSRYASQANIHSKRNSTAMQNNMMQQNNVRSMATLRVLSVLRHWVSKHSQDFVNDSKLGAMTQEFLQDLIMDTSLLPAEHKSAIQLQQMIQKASHSRGNRVDLDVLLAPPMKASPDSIETLSALEIAEGITYLDSQIFLAIRSEEFLGQAWMKSDKAIKAPHILLITKRFNDVSRLVSSEIMRVPELPRRVAIIEKWTNVAHICRVIHNFNGVLQICAAFTNSAVFRLKKTWDKIPKTTKQTIDQLQNLVSTDSRFRNMRDAINRCDPPSIPYVGMYLTDLSFIEEGTPNCSPEGLLNFSKMRMIAHVIREIQHLQNGGVYKFEVSPRVANYLLDSSRHLQDDEMYRCSLAIEPRLSGAKNNNAPLPNNNASISASVSPHPSSANGQA